MTRFDPYSAVYGAHTPASLGNVLADAERGGFEVEPRWIVTTMGPIRATSIHEPDGWTGEGRRWIEVSIPCPLSPHGDDDWGFDTAAEHDERAAPVRTVSRCAITHNGPRCDGPCAYYQPGDQFEPFSGLF